VIPGRYTWGCYDAQSPMRVIPLKAARAWLDHPRPIARITLRSDVDMRPGARRPRVTMVVSGSSPTVDARASGFPSLVSGGALRFWGRTRPNERSPCAILYLWHAL
jgi:hypothetical protein